MNTLPARLRRHLAALRALLVFTVICGVLYPLAVTAVARAPGLRHKADGSRVSADGRGVGSALIGQRFTDVRGNPLGQYFQSRPSAAGDGYDPAASGASNLGPEDVVDSLPDPALARAGEPDPDARQSLLTQICARSKAIGAREGVDGSRPYCTGGGVGAVLSVIGPRDARGAVVRPTRVVSVNEACPATPFLATYRGVRVECRTPGEDVGAGRIIPVRGGAPTRPAVPSDAVTASASGLDPHISPAYARLQAGRVARARGVGVDRVHALIDRHTTRRTLGFMGEPAVNVLQLNTDLDRTAPYRG
ncbi:potassium-transporting ATPase subunit C [Actinomadura livida]|uniref:Potassium-transporting ATPase KdpC subunit n=1 Tax=Actinomadura livida TaxID=79909 RepID=A0A7W7I955_9ACTN|nr:MULTISPECIES: potassium-transporting ATPase subunit C [Actinomadura]MBB4772739.1 K+-transporting ATPase ATPase C chain [Actinomadura catellatispora]GGU12424.1 potassium-transporting ATPase KdpC subunit [Actinomadura livida]